MSLMAETKFTLFNNMADSLTFMLLVRPADDLTLGVQYYIKVTLQLLCFGSLHISEGFGDLPCMMSQRVLRPLVQAGVLLCLLNVCNKTNGPLQQKAVKKRVESAVFCFFLFFHETGTIKKPLRTSNVVLQFWLPGPCIPNLSCCFELSGIH